MAPRYRYTKAELERLDELAEQDTPERIARRYNSWAKANGYPERTIPALKFKLTTMGYSHCPNGGNRQSARRWAEELGLAHLTVSRWWRKGELDGKRTGHIINISRNALKVYAKKHPEKFIKVPYVTRHEIFGREIADLIEETTPFNQPFKILDTETKKIYDSLSHCSKGSGLYGPNPYRQKIKKMILRGERFEYFYDD